MWWYRFWDYLDTLPIEEIVAVVIGVGMIVFIVAGLICWFLKKRG